MPGENTNHALDRDQELILAVYSFYTDEKDHIYLQYTAACAIFYYLTRKGYFNYALNELLVYDYKEWRRYIWEAKKFMKDINDIRDLNYLIRARSRSKTYRDVNAHQCSAQGKEYIEEKRKNDKEFDSLLNKVRTELSDSRGELCDVLLADEGPELVMVRKKNKLVTQKKIDGFLKDLCQHEKAGTNEEKYCLGESYEPFFI
jgi:hypothetical protein